MESGLTDAWPEANEADVAYIADGATTASVLSFASAEVESEGGPAVIGI